MSTISLDFWRIPRWALKVLHLPVDNYYEYFIGRVSMLTRRPGVIFIASLILISTVFFSLAGCKENDQTLPIGALVDSDGAYIITSANLGGSFSLSGTVKAKASQETIGNVVVALSLNGKSVASTKTSAEGKFFFTGLISGVYDLLAADNSVDYASTSYVVHISSNGTSSPAAPEILLESKVSADGVITAKISGSVFNASTKAPVDSIEVRLMGPGIDRGDTTTQEGKFFFNDVGTGTYTLEAAKESQVYKDSSITVKVLDDGSTSPIAPQIFLTPQASENFTISGIISLAGSNEGISAILVQLRKNATDSTILQETYSSGEGRFFFQDLTSGLYFLTVPKTREYNEKAYPVRILSDGTISPKESKIALTQIPGLNTFDVSGHLRDAFSNAPLEYVTCSIKGIGSNLTDRNGKFFFQNVSTGTYELEFTKDGFSTLNVSFSVFGAGKTQPASLSFPMIYNVESGKGSIAGRIVNEADGKGIPNYYVALYNWEYVTKTKYIITSYDTFNNPVKTKVVESNWEAVLNKFKVTRTSDVAVGDNIDDVGTYKLTHLSPALKYVVFIGKTSSTMGLRVDTTRSGTANGSYFDWYIPNTADPNCYAVWTNVTVMPDTTTFLSNYDPPK